MELSYEYRIYPNAAQRKAIARTFGCCRFVYNRALSLRREARDAGGRVPTIFQIDKMLPGWKADPETSWLREADSIALQQSLRDLDRAYKNFFRAPGKTGFPKFKSKRVRQSYRTNRVEVVDPRHVKLPKLGVVRARVSRMPEGRILSATVKRVPSGKYFVSLCCTDVTRADPAPAGTAVGVDVGVESLMTLSDGTKVANPRAVGRFERKLAREQRRLSRKRRGVQQPRPAARPRGARAGEGGQRPQGRHAQGDHQAGGREPSRLPGGPEREGHTPQPPALKGRRGRVPLRGRAPAGVQVRHARRGRGQGRQVLPVEQDLLMLRA